MLSVIIPMYNSVENVASLVTMITSQTYARYEVIIVDDGSSDKTLAALQRAAQSHERLLIIEQTNQGAAAARNRGLAHARGDYVMFLDCDDVYHCDLFESVVSVMSTSGADMCVFEAGAIDCRSEMQNDYISYGAYEEGLYSRDSFGADLFDIVRTVPWNKCFKRTFLSENNLEFQSLPVNNDVCFSITASVRAKTIYILRKKLIDYRMYLGASLQDKRGRHPECALRAVDEVWVRCGREIESSEPMLKAYNSLALNAFYYSFYASIENEKSSYGVWKLFKSSHAYCTIETHVNRTFAKQSDYIKFYAVKYSSYSSLRHACWMHADHRDARKAQKAFLAIRLIVAGTMGLIRHDWGTNELA